MFRRFVHFPVLYIEKYRYDENRVANPNFKKSLEHFKSPYIGLKMPRTLFKRIPIFAFLATLV
jgi:hypothetical protein